MIYILGKNDYYDNSDLDDIIIQASTKIEDILDSLLNVNIDYLQDYTILATPENSRLFGIIYPRECEYECFVDYTPPMYTMEEYKDEYEHVKNQLFVWCNKIKERRIREEAERKLLLKEKEEKRERELYEKLKAKYGE